MPDLEENSAPPIKHAVRSAFDNHSGAVLASLLALRTLIFETVEETPNIGRIDESLKWGQPSYTPAKPHIGSSVRLGAAETETVALYFICHTRLVEHFREIYPKVLEFEGNRAIVLPASGEWPEAEIKHCIAMALTYHLKVS